ncbi:hypothetical protein A8B75_11610 [Sphingomonadales bacterium EhC05]|nr:hypothetical protein A8B75_11610 [Sphingomonadales bacterium EhC05]
MIDPDTTRAITDPVAVAYGVAAIFAIIAGAFWIKEYERSKPGERKRYAEFLTGTAFIAGGAGYLFDILV